MEDARTGLIELVIEKSVYAHDPDRGQIRDVRFRNISVVGGEFPTSRIRGWDEDHTIEDVTIENLVIHGTPILDAETGKFQVGPHVKNVTFNSSGIR